MTSSTVAFFVPMKLYSFCIATSVLLSDFDTLYLFFFYSSSLTSVDCEVTIEVCLTCTHLRALLAIDLAPLCR